MFGKMKRNIRRRWKMPLIISSPNNGGFITPLPRFINME